jgi:hypothetical protein
MEKSTKEVAYTLEKAPFYVAGAEDHNARKFKYSYPLVFRTIM